MFFKYLNIHNFYGKQKFDQNGLIYIEGLKELLWTEEPTDSTRHAFFFF